jgi:hypothetical protein
MFDVFGFHTIEGIMKFEENLRVKPKVKRTFKTVDPYLALNKLGPKKSQLRPLQKSATSTIAPINEADEEEDEFLAAKLSAVMKIEIGNMSKEK